MARPIDADAVLDRYYAEFDRQDICDGSQDRDWLMRCIEEAPTLTQPNEPLTLKELTLMTEPTPVWWDWVQGWVLARKGMIISWNGVYYNFGEVKGNFYRRPPEGEEEENDVIEITENL